MTANRFLTIVLAVIAICLTKLAFFPATHLGDAVIPPAYAQGGVIEWQGGKRIVTSSGDGATTYVWDYDGKTQVRKYSIKDNALVLETFKLGE
jgi:hypothetical protein